MNRLSRKLMYVLLIVLVLTVGLNSLVLYRNITRLSNAKIKIETMNKANELADYLSNKIDEGSISEEVITVIDMMDVSVSVLTPRKRVIYSNIPTIRVRALWSKEGIIGSQAPILNEDETIIASVLVTARNSEIEQLNSVFKAALFSSIILGLLIVVIFMLVLHILVNKPLKKIMVAMEKDEPLVLSKKSDWIIVGDIYNKAREKRLQQRISQNRFLQNASHELKSPLMNIQGYMEGLEDKIYTEAEASKMVISESQRIKGLVDQMIRTSKAEVIEQSDLKIEEIDMQSFINELSKMVPKNLEFNYKGNQASMFFDRTVLQIIMDNLIQNACRYAHTSIDVIYDMNQVNHTNNITVRDDGVGIDVVIIDSLFDRFVKGENGKTGLGLSIVKQYVEATEGVIRAFNDEGAVFELSWRL